MKAGSASDATYENPAADAGEAAEALRGLAHATRVIAEASDTYRVLGALSTALASFGQSLDQLADWHDRNAGHAATDDGDRRAGRQEAEAAGEYLRDAAGRIRLAHGALNEAFSHNGRIVWHAGIEAGLIHPSRGRAERLAPPSAFGADPASREGPGSFGR
jgi:hypothetical protein